MMVTWSGKRGRDVALTNEPESKAVGEALPAGGSGSVNLWRLYRHLGRRSLAALWRRLRLDRESMPSRDRYLVMLVFVVGVVFATAGFFAVGHHFQGKAQREFEGPARQFTAVLTRALDGYLGSLNAVRAFMTASNDVGRWEFFEYTRENLPRYPGTRSLEWIPRITEQERVPFERMARDDGLFGFLFTERDRAGLSVTAQRRPHHYPIYFVEPFNGNEDRLGLDLAADATVVEVLHLARDVGSAVATRHSAKQPSFAVVLPIYRDNKVPDTVQGRRDNLLGFVRGIFDIGAIVGDAWPDLVNLSGFDVYLFDTDDTKGARTLYYHPSPLRDAAPIPLPETEVLRGLYTAATYGLAGWDWLIVVKAVSSPFTYNVGMAAWGFWAISLLLTSLLLQHLVSAQTRTKEIEQSVTARTAELSLANAFLKEEIDERVRIEEELRAAKDQAEAATRTKAEFLAMMSHELRTPLNAVIGFSEIIGRESLGPVGHSQYRDYAEDIRLSGTHLLTLINDILDLSKIEGKRFELQDEVVDLSAILGSVYPLLKPKIEDGALSFRRSFDTPRHRLRADERALRQILMNLLSNAIKFTPKGGRISVGTQLDDTGRFLITVSDTGIGIAEHDIKAALQPFNQVDSSLSRRYEGTGLGLPLSQRLMRLHDGVLEIDSSLGQGTKITLIFPSDRVVEMPPLSIVADDEDEDLGPNVPRLHARRGRRR